MSFTQSIAAFLADPTAPPVATGGMTNPIGTFQPDPSVGGPAFTAWWGHLFEGGWFLAILATIVFLAAALVKLHKATNNNIPGQADEAKTHATAAAVALAAEVGLTVIVGAIVTFAG